MDNVNDTYFDGHYKEIWRSYIPEVLTEKETDFMIRHFQLQPGSTVLDIMCGYGRHALALGRKGIHTTAVDNLGDYIGEIKEIAATEQLPVTAVQSGVLEFLPGTGYDLAICMGNSLNFFPAAETITILKKLSAALKPGGGLFINSWSISEIILRNPKTVSTEEVGEIRIEHDAKFLFHPTRVEVQSVIQLPDGTQERKQAVDYIFSIDEMEYMLNQAGFRLEELWSVPGRKPFSVGEPRVYITAIKI